jgi:ribosomal protein S12 methylthiotransferase
MKTKTSGPEKVNVITLGCSKNWVDSENLLTQLKANDIHADHESQDNDADVIIVNFITPGSKPKNKSKNYT